MQTLCHAARARTVAVVWFSVASVGFSGLSATCAKAQMVNVGTPYHALSDSFYEYTGVNWGFKWKGLSASFGGSNLAIPQFGGFSPNSGINSGFSIGGNRGHGVLNFSSAQGSRRSYVGQSPVITLSHGYPGYIYDGAMSPFVLGQIPVVGGYPSFTPLATMPPVYPLDGVEVSRVLESLDTSATDPNKSEVDNDRDDGRDSRRRQATRSVGAVATEVSSATRTAPSVAEARRLHAAELAEREGEARMLFERGIAAEENGSLGAAATYYRMALPRSSRMLHEQIQSRLHGLATGKSRRGP